MHRRGRPVPAALAVLAALLATRLPLLAAGPDAQLSLFMDDACYYLEAARRTVEGHAWPGMDGREPTNGFHPLYMALVIALQAAAGTDPRVVLPLVMVFQLALGAAAVMLVHRHVARSHGESAALPVGLWLALDPGWTQHGLCGVENGLSSLLLLLAALRAAKRLGEANEIPAGLGSWAIDGLLLGLAMAARTDSALFALPCLAFAGFREARRHGLAAALRGVLAAGLVALAVLSPWLLLNLARFGTIVQDSSAALAARYAKTYGPHLSPESLRISLGILVFWIFRALWAGGLVPLTAWALGLATPFDRLRRPERAFAGWAVAALAAAALFLRGNDTADIRHVPTAVAELALGMLAFAAGLISPRPPLPRAPLFTGMLAVWTLLTVAAYAFFFRGFQVWYSTGVCLVAVLVPAALAMASALRGRRALATAMVLLVAVQAALVHREMMTRGMREGMRRDLLAQGDSLGRRLDAFSAAAPGPVRFGAFDSGKLSYVVHPFPVSNTDGVMNHRASLALREGRLAEYFGSAGITHLLGGADRLSEFASVSRFGFTPDTAATNAIGNEVWRVVPLP